METLFRTFRTTRYLSRCAERLSTLYKIKTLIDRIRVIIRITDKHLKLVMTLIALSLKKTNVGSMCILHKRFSPESANKRMDGRTDRQTGRRYQVHYLPRFEVVNDYLL